MLLRIPILLLGILLTWTACESPAGEGSEAPPDEARPIEVESASSPFWKNAIVYFLLTDRFYNGDPSNDQSLGRTPDGALLRNFEGGDLKGVTQKIEAGYFDSLGVNVLWMTPVVEQVHGKVDEGTGPTYGYHGYWARDWTRIDPNFGTAADLRELVAAAHRRGIRVLMDVVVNHTGPVTPLDSQWPDEWVRTGPQCTYTGYETTVSCTLVENLPDIRTDSDTPVELPPFLLAKWEAERRLDRELAELDAFFEQTGYPRAPRYYIIKWLTDWVREVGIDGYRVDTAKHTEAEVWADLKREAVRAYRDWKRDHPEEAPSADDFYMVGEVYGYGVGGGRDYDYGDRRVDFFDYGFESLINFAFKSDAVQSPYQLFTKYAAALNDGPLRELAILNYIASHDDGDPFDRQRERALEAGTKLLLSPGGVQVYYGDETARPLAVEGANGDANLRSVMNWEDVDRNTVRNGLATRDVLEHWRKLGRFRREHPAVGAGVHEPLQETPYLFQRTLATDAGIDRVLVGMDLPDGPKVLSVGDDFPEGTSLLDYYSGTEVVVENGQVSLETPFALVLLGSSRE